METPATNAHQNRKGILAGVLILFALVAVFAVFSALSPSEQFGDPSGFGREKIGVVEIFGPIMQSDDVVTQIHKFADDGSIKAIIIRIDSPGGAVAPSQEIYNAVVKARKSKKVVASMATVAASGGYYIAVGAEKIFANPGSITGSIGVIMGFVDLQELMKKIGLQGVVIKSGPYKDIGANDRPFTDADRKVLQDVIDDVYAQFVSAVAKGRGLDEAKVRALADGRVYSGRMAKERGMIDELGGMDEAADYTAKIAGIKGKPKLVRERPKFGLLKEILGEKISTKFDWLVNEASVHKPGVYYLWQMN
ncbi:MAG: signal peptide peptidase SppA [Nitrospinae bacterium]|nr:signal peptide peptidase SppA [Nitrospinota bacterium]